MIANMSLLWISYLGLTEDSDFDMKVTGCHFPSSVETCKRTAPVVKSELSALIQNGFVESSKMRTGTEVTLSFSLSKAVHSAVPQLYFTSFQIRLESGRACSE